MIHFAKQLIPALADFPAMRMRGGLGQRGSGTNCNCITRASTKDAVVFSASWAMFQCVRLTTVRRICDRIAGKSRVWLNTWLALGVNGPPLGESVGKERY